MDYYTRCEQIGSTELAQSLNDDQWWHDSYDRPDGWVLLGHGGTRQAYIHLDDPSVVYKVSHDARMQCREVRRIYEAASYPEYQRWVPLTRLVYDRRGRAVVIMERLTPYFDRPDRNGQLHELMCRWSPLMGIADTGARNVCWREDQLVLIDWGETQGAVQVPGSGHWRAEYESQVEAAAVRALTALELREYQHPLRVVFD
jgi:hypothetical protein